MNKDMQENIETPPVVAETLQPSSIADDQIQAIMWIAQHAKELGVAFDGMRKFIFQRALQGDWVRFGQEGKPGYLELTGAGSFRIAAFLGISWINWKFWKEQGTDSKGEFVTYWYQCDCKFKNRIIEGVQGRAGSRDKFFGYTIDGGWKELSDVRETDIQVAARRNAMKEGVKLMLGLLHIPEEAAASLGLPAHVIRGYTFGKNQPPAEKSAAPAGESKTEETQTPPADLKKMTITVKEITAKTGPNWTRYSIVSDRDAKFTTFDTNLAQTAKDAKANGSQVEIEYVTSKYGNEIKNLRSVNTDGVSQ